MYRNLCIYLALCATLFHYGIEAQDDDRPEEGGLDFTVPTAVVDGAKGGTSFAYDETFCEDTSDNIDDQMLGCQLKAPNTNFELRVCKLASGIRIAIAVV